jgi:hypothetical protein
MSSVYRNRLIINQRGGSILIDSSTEQEKVKLSHRSGSNINLTNVVNSELATNNKQTNVVHDNFSTVGNDSTNFVGKNYTLRTGENTYQLKGFLNQNQIDAFGIWKETFNSVAELNSEFKILRGGLGYPNGISTDLIGERADNPVINSKTYTVENTFNGYSGTPKRTSGSDEVAMYSKVPDRGTTKAASERSITVEDIQKSAGTSGSNAPGVLEFGASKSAATEGGVWEPNEDALKINDAILAIQNDLNAIEQEMGNGGDEILITKRNKVEQIGAIFNDYPSVRIDEKGRSQPFEMLVSDTGTFKNHDYVPHVEEVDNSSNFPCGNDDATVGNRLSRNVGSGGVHLKTTGSFEIGGTSVKIGAIKLNINATHGVHLASENFIDISSLKTITLRTNRQVYIESALGVKGNAIVGGGLSVEGETYLQHITAPLEVHQTEDTTVYGKFATDTEDTLLIGWAHVGSRKYPVYASINEDLIVNYPHSHHHNGLPMRLMKSNKDVRKIAQAEIINVHNNISQAHAQNHEKKNALEVL